MRWHLVADAKQRAKAVAMDRTGKKYRKSATAEKEGGSEPLILTLAWEPNHLEESSDMSIRDSYAPQACPVWQGRG